AAINELSVVTSGLQSYTGATTLNGNLTTALGTVDVTGAPTLGANTVIDTTNGGLAAAGANITFNGTGSTINGAKTLTLTGGTGGTVSLQGAVGGTAPLTSLTASGAAINELSVVTSGLQSYTGATTLNGNLTTA